MLLVKSKTESKADEWYSRAMFVNDRVQQRFRLDMISDHAIEKIDSFVNGQWRELPVSMAEKGIKYSVLGENCELLYMPKKKRVHKHWHETTKEFIKIIHGSVEYELYIGDNKTESGVLNQWDELIILPKIKHVVFSAKDEAYLYLEFKN